MEPNNKTLPYMAIGEPNTNLNKCFLFKPFFQTLSSYWAKDIFLIKIFTISSLFPAPYTFCPPTQYFFLSPERSAKELFYLIKFSYLCFHFNKENKTRRRSRAAHTTKHS